MRIPPDAKLYELRPLTGPLDPSSSPDAVLAGGHRWVQNFRVNSSGALVRSSGFKRLLYSTTSNNNADLHNQLENTTSGSTPEDINFLFQVETTNGFTKLLAGTKSRLYALNTKTNNWKLIGEQLATTGKWKAAQLGEFIVFVNESAKPVYYKLDQPRESERNSSDALVDKVNSLREIDSFKTIGLNRVRHIKEWRGLMFYANVHEGNEWVPDRLVWSDFKKPFEITPNVADSLAGYQDLGQGEDIVGMEPLANVLLIYTTRGIWQFEIAGGTGTDVLTFRKRYSEDDGGNMVLSYPNTLASAGDHHFYLGKDGIYAYNVYKGSPTKPDWLHLASSVIFDDINKDLCDLPIAQFNAKTNEIWISWPSKNATKNDKSLIINTKYQHVSYMDAGFTAFENYKQVSYTSIAEWAIANCICSEGGTGAGDLNDHGIHQYRDSAEGSSVCSGSENFSTTRCTLNGNQYNNLFTTVTKTYSDSAFPGENITTEDWTGSATDYTLYTKLGSTTFADLCEPPCPDEVRFVMAWSKDNCLKEDGNGFKRERCTSTHPYNSCATYIEEDFNSILTSPALRLNDPTRDKLMRALTLEFDHEVAKKGGKIHLRIGNSAQAADPNKVGCGLIWKKQSPEAGKDIQCVTNYDRNAHVSLGTRASDELTWPLYEQGRNLYYEISVNGTEGEFEATAIRIYAATKKA
tara:strand:- start:1706 stop:3778 length:2073 start_codon:yes stop_codon:yes gene_type:complete